MNEYALFITCPKDIERLLVSELQSLDITVGKTTLAGVYAQTNLEGIYRIHLRSRLANRVLLILAETTVTNADDLYQAVHAVDWHHHMLPHHSLWIEATGHCPGINTNQFAAQKIKDALVDKLRTDTGLRPNIQKDEPDIAINVHVHQGIATICLDLSGMSLHRRGYRQEATEAPLKENLAAALLIQAGWPALASEDAALVDPMCGSGTLLIEGAMIAANIAPGLYRHYFGFLAWLGHDAMLWQSLRQAALDQREQALACESWPLICGYDAEPKAISIARSNITRAGLDDHIRVSVKELGKLTKPTHRIINQGLLITNPPYGQRLSDALTLTGLYQSLGQKLREHFVGWHAAVFTGNPELGKTMGIRARKKYAFHNGSLACDLLLFTLTPEAWVLTPYEKKTSLPTENNSIEAAPILDDAGLMLANRLRKNMARLKSWVKQQHIACYRVYDADLPEYAAAIDYYPSGIHIQEYKAPKTIPDDIAAARLQTIVQTCQVVFNRPLSQLVLKERRRQKGSDQYIKQDNTGHFDKVSEYGCELLVNLHDYLDTGLFLDHRPVRHYIQQHVKNKTFLNLFCYTGAASVHAAKGGARNSLSLDLSNVYTAWAKRNLALNGFSDSLHPVLTTNCLTWLKEQAAMPQPKRYDLILLDPPTFSNSKKMDGVLVIERDHVTLIDQAMKLLAADGTLIFSTNFRQMKLEPTLQTRYHITDFTAKSFDPDFARDQRLHHCWLIRHSTPL